MPALVHFVPRVSRYKQHQETWIAGTAVYIYQFFVCFLDPMILCFVQSDIRTHYDQHIRFGFWFPECVGKGGTIVIQADT